jgi:hypothetical protein
VGRCQLKNRLLAKSGRRDKGAGIVGVTSKIIVFIEEWYQAAFHGAAELIVGCEVSNTA